MYIETNGAVYPCVGYRPPAVHPEAEKETCFLLAGEDMPEVLGETVELRQDDEFLLATVVVADYARWAVEGHTLVLTDRPVPVPQPDPEPEAPTPTLQEAMLDMLADLDYRVSDMELAALAAESNE